MSSVWPMPVVAIPAQPLAFQDAAFVNPEVLKLLAADAGRPEDSAFVPCQVGALHLIVKGDVRVPGGRKGEASIALGSLHRNAGRIHMSKPVSVTPLRTFPPAWAALTVTLQLTAMTRGVSASTEVDGRAAVCQVKDQLAGHAFVLNQACALYVNDKSGSRVAMKATVVEAAHGEAAAAGAAAGGGGGGGGTFILSGKTDIMLRRGKDQVFKLSSSGSKTQGKSIFAQGFDFSQLGVGGLAKEFEVILRKTFSSRLLPPAVAAEMGVQHVRGMLLHGPPGCGKTLIARQIGKALHAHEPKIVNGPEVLDKYVGEAEANLRRLFEDAEAEQAEKGDDSDLHIIIFDEIDAICKKRGSISSGTGVHDSMVNQLLSKIDGVEPLNNILLIGMTNRKDMLDPALLRPGRLEVHVEIGLPNEAGREEILNIHTAKLKASGKLGEDVTLPEVAQATKNFTGAELRAVVEQARAFAVSRHMDPSNLGRMVDASRLKVTQQDFLDAADDTTPAFGVDEDELGRYTRGGIIEFSDAVKQIHSAVEEIAWSVRNQEHDQAAVATVLLTGPSTCGRTAMAVHAAQRTGFPFIKRIGADSLLGLLEVGKVHRLQEEFEAAYRSRCAVIVIDDIERIIEWVAIGGRFSNIVLQALIGLLNMPPPTGSRMLVIGTTSKEDALEQLGLGDNFTTILEMPMISTSEEVASVLHARGMPGPAAADAAKLIIDDGEQRQIGIRRLLEVFERARQVCKRQMLEAAMEEAGEAAAGGAGDADQAPSISDADAAANLTAEAVAQSALSMNLFR